MKPSFSRTLSIALAIALLAVPLAALAGTFSDNFPGFCRYAPDFCAWADCQMDGC